MGSSQNWLAFSLSPLEMPNNTSHPHVDSSHLCLVEAFNSNGWSNQNRSVERVEDESGDLSMITAGGHKLEDFLGGASLGRFSGNPTSESSAVYDSHPKTIAAGCLQVFSTVQTSTDQSELGKAILPVELVSKKSIDTFGQRTSIYRGVTRHRWTGRYEAHLWDNSCRREGQSRKGRQVYLGGYDKEEKAARAYDLAALKYWGLTTTTNFPVSNYEKELEEMKNMTRQQFVASLRRKSSGFSRGASIYRGVTRHHQHGRWQARIGRVAGNKDLYLGTFSTQEEAAAAYDIAAIKFRGLNAVTNFDMSRYDVQSIVSSDLPIGGVTNGIKASESSDKGSETKHHDDQEQASFTSQLEPLSFSLPIKPDQDCPLLAFQNPAQNTAKNTHFQHSTNGSAFQRLSNLEPPVTLDFSTIYGINQIQSHGFVNGGGLFLQNLTIPPALAAGPRNLHYLYQQPSTFVRSTTNCDNSSYTNWVTPSVHAFQAARPNLAVIQTPIFSME